MNTESRPEGQAPAAPPSIPAEHEDIEAVIACLGDDAAQLRDANPEDECADNMDDAATMLRTLLDANSAVARLLLDQNREGAKAWARGIHINMDRNGGLTVSAEVAAPPSGVQAVPALPDADCPAFYKAFEEWATATHLDMKRKGDGYRSPTTQLCMESAFGVVNRLRAAAPPVAPAPARERWPGIETLRNVIDCLRGAACYADEEGEATDRLEDLLHALSAAAPAEPPAVEADAKREQVKKVLTLAQNWHIATAFGSADPPGTRMTLRDELRAAVYALAGVPLDPIDAALDEAVRASSAAVQAAPTVKE